MKFDRFQKRNRAVYRHDGTPEDWLDEHRRACSRLFRFREKGVIEISRSLFHRASDERGLSLAWQHVRKKSGETPGPDDDGLPMPTLTRSEMFACCRGLRDAIRGGEYQHGPTRSVRLPKFGGGTRTIQIANYDDRIVAYAAFQVLMPLLDPMLGDDCFGSRPGRSWFHAFARLEGLLREGYGVVVVADIRKAFDNVPRGPLRDIVRSILQPSDVKQEADIEAVTAFLDHLDHAVGGTREIGIPQGNAVSPLLMNIYADRRIDRPWRRRHRDLPLLRYVDDLLVVARTVDQANQARADLDRLVNSAGMALKGDASESIVNLAAGESFSWLGHQISFDGGNMIVRLRPDELQRLVFKLERVEDQRKNPAQAMLHWIRSRGPAYQFENRREVIDMIYEAAEIAGPMVRATPRELVREWRRGDRQWQELRTSLLSTM